MLSELGMQQLHEGEQALNLLMTFLHQSKIVPKDLVLSDQSILETMDKFNKGMIKPPPDEIECANRLLALTATPMTLEMKAAAERWVLALRTKLEARMEFLMLITKKQGV